MTGGAGFIGSNIVARLTAEGRDVIVCDRLREAALGKWRNLAKHPIADLIAPEGLPAWLASNGAADLDLVIHMGAISSTLEPDADPDFIKQFRAFPGSLPMVRLAGDAPDICLLGRHLRGWDSWV